MKKLLVALFLLLTTTCYAGVLTTEVKVKINNNYREEFLRAAPNNEMTCDPITVDNCVPEHKYTDSQWIDEVVKRYLQKLIQTGEKKLYDDIYQQTGVILE